MRPLLATLALLLVAPVTAQTPYVQLHLDGQTASGITTHDQGWVRFLPDAEMGWDRHDGSKYMPPISTYAIFALMGERAGSPHYLAVSSLPDGTAQALPRRIDVRVDLAATEAGTFTFSWDDAYLPSGWKAFLIDRQTGAKVKMWRRTSYTFSTEATGWDNRFKLRIRPPRSLHVAPVAPTPTASALTTSHEPTAPFEVTAPAPNPTRGSARLGVSLPEADHVAVAIYDALGREVAGLDARDYSTGSHTLALPTDGLPPGTYLVRVSTPRETRTHRFSVVR